MLGGPLLVEFALSSSCLLVCQAYISSGIPIVL